MKHKTESWNGAAASDSTSSTVRRSLTRAGLQLGQLSHVVSGALSTLQGGQRGQGGQGGQGGASPPGTPGARAAQNRMRALLSQDRALLAHRACGQASLEDEEPEAPQVPLKGTQTRSAAQNRMRELLNQDRALLALREARRRENPTSEPIDDDFAAELVQLVDREWTPVPVPMQEPTSAQSTTVGVAHASPSTLFDASASGSRATCVGATTSFVAEPSVPAICTPGPAAKSALSAAPAQPVRVSQPAVSPAPAVALSAPAPSPRPAAAASSEESGGDPIRTRGMAKLLALQGYRDRALSIYDELIAAEPDNAELRAEADRLRN